MVLRGLPVKYVLVAAWAFICVCCFGWPYGLLALIGGAARDFYDWCCEEGDR